MSGGTVRYALQGAVAEIVFDRPHARNAMTWRMYEQLAEACDDIGGRDNVKVVILRGAGEQAFIAGTDITQFENFDAEKGLEYEASLEAGLQKLERLKAVTVAVLRGYAVGGGLVIAAVCDLRIATPGARLGMPIAHTVGNCLSAPNLARLAHLLGSAQVRSMILSGEFVHAEQALAIGAILFVAEDAELEDRLAKLCEKLQRASPNSIYAAKEGLRRLAQSGLPDVTDLIRLCYGSKDFKERVRGFAAKSGQSGARQSRQARSGGAS